MTLSFSSRPTRLALGMVLLCPCSTRSKNPQRLVGLGLLNTTWPSHRARVLFGSKIPLGFTVGENLMSDLGMGRSIASRNHGNKSNTQPSVLVSSGFHVLSFIVGNPVATRRIQGGRTTHGEPEGRVAHHHKATKIGVWTTTPINQEPWLRRASRQREHLGVD